MPTEDKIPPESKKEINEIKKNSDERTTPISQKEIVNGQLKTTLFFDSEKPLLSPLCGKDEYWRHLTGILVEDGSSQLDLCSLAPAGCRFETNAAIHENQKLEPLIPSASTTLKEPIIVALNPDIYKFRGGILATLHEIGHAWQRFEGRMKNSLESRKLLRDFSKNKKDGISKEEVLEALDLINKEENDAWEFALNKYREFKDKGLDLAPDFSEEEIETYPQFIYDELYNLNLIPVAEAVGRARALIWRPK